MAGCDDVAAGLFLLVDRTSARFAGKFTRLERAWVGTADEGYDSTSH